jgi:uncharacterized protein (DUF1501 family)
MATLRRTKKGRASVSRRDFLRVGGLSVVSLSVAEQAARARMHQSADRRSCILILMTGGPSQLETFDPKPTAGAEIRGPLKSISTSVPGLSFSEALPRLAKRAHTLAVVRTLHHDAAPIHETGQQLLQTGRLAKRGVQYPSFGSVVARTLGPRSDVAPYVVLPRTLGETGVPAYQGQHSGFLGNDFAPLSADSTMQTAAAGGSTIGELLSQSPMFSEPESVQRAYGTHRFGTLCLQARQLVECGVRCVTVNLFDSLVNQVTWDCHARAPWAPGTLYDYRDTLGPPFDQAVSALLEDLEQRGLIQDTLVVAAGEMGRTPYLNEFGGRDHWTTTGSAILAGGQVAGGATIGSTSRDGTTVVDRPVAYPELTATIYRHLGLDLDMPLPLAEGSPEPLAEMPMIGEVFA